MADKQCMNNNKGDKMSNLKRLEQELIKCEQNKDFVGVVIVRDKIKQEIKRLYGNEISKKK